MSEAWKKHDRPCEPCPDCGAELYEKFWGNGGWVTTDKETEHTHGASDCVQELRRHIVYLVRASDTLIAASRDGSALREPTDALESELAALPERLLRAARK